MSILNLTQYPVTAEQKAAGVFDLPPEQRAELTHLLTFEEIPSAEEILAACEDIATLAAMHADEAERSDDPDDPAAVFSGDGHGTATHAMIGGALWLMGPLSAALRSHLMEPVFAFSRRESVEEAQADGSVRKVGVFRHVGFVPAA